MKLIYKVIRRTVDWKWVGISYLLALIIFGVSALIKSDLTVLFGGLVTLSIFFILLAIFSISWDAVKNNTAKGWRLGDRWGNRSTKLSTTNEL